MEETKLFIGQRMNLDVDEKLLKPEETREVYNALADISGTMLKFKGNTAVSTTLPSGVNKVLTSAKDHARNAIIYFIWNSLGNHCIMRYREGKIDRVLYMKSVLNFQWEKPVTHAIVVGDTLLWTDGYDKGLDNNPPRSINYIKAVGTNYGYNQATMYSEFDVVNSGNKVYEYISKTKATGVPVSNEEYWKLKGRIYDLSDEKLTWIMDVIKYPKIAQVPVVKYKNV